jgi:hypothetical protein
MRKYFKYYTESDLGSGTGYLEFEDEWAVRQVEIFGGRWFCSNKEYHPEIGLGLCDQPFSALDLGPDEEITKEEFDAAWDEAQRRES